MSKTARSRALSHAAVPISALVLLGGLLARSAVVRTAVSEGLALCATAVVPGLFPCLVAVSLAVNGGLFSWLRRCGLPAGGAVFALGLVGGYGVGPAAVHALVSGGAVSRHDGERMLTYANNAGPAFLLTIAGLGVFGSLQVGLVLWGVHIVAAALSALCCGGFRRVAAVEMAGDAAKPPKLCAAFVEAVQSSAVTMLRLCGFVVFFTVLRALLPSAWGTVPWVAGFLELTVGLTALAPTAQNFVWAAALLGWGGLSVHAQCAAIAPGLSLRRYLAAKLLHALFSAALAAAVVALWG